MLDKQIRSITKQICTWLQNPPHGVYNQLDLNT